MIVDWLEQSVADVPPDDDWLTADEAARLAGFHIPKRRSDWRLGRWTAKQAVARRLRISRLSDIEIRSAPSGAPEAFFAGRPADLSLSISHRAQVALCATAPPGEALGCDLELVEPRSDAFLADYFTPAEQALVARSSDRFGMLALLWSAKESALKALRTGLRLDTRSVAVSLGETSAELWQPFTVHCPEGKILHGRWQCEGSWVRTLVARKLVSAAPRP